MSEKQERVFALGAGLSVAARHEGNRLTLVVGMKTDADCLLHWGLSDRPGVAWQRPPEACWPAGTAAAGGQAVRTPLVSNGKGEQAVAIYLDLPCPWRSLSFVLYFPKEKRWFKSGNQNFSIPLPRKPGGTLSAEEALKAWGPNAAAVLRVFPLDGGDRLAVAISATPDAVCVDMACDAEPPLVLHWGIAWQFQHEWVLPPENLRPAGTAVFDHQAVRTSFTERDDLRYLRLEFHKPAESPGPRGLKFVLYRPEDNAWLKSGGKDFYLPLFERPRDSRLSPKLWELAEPIVEAEKSMPYWSLMHRFNLCHDLLEKATDEDGLALLFAWLRFSATRQLDWQRQFNTKPRELAFAQDRLTTRLASLWRSLPAQADGSETTGRRWWVRRLLTTLGRGGEGQRVRDEILHIMHRNNIKEVSHHFIEEWHQKLHNNTTADDIVICTAYLAFMKSNGDTAVFYRVLEEGGVSRERLASFERPIKTAPEFFADRKEALIRDFENFLRVLNAVHAGTDLDSAVGAARGSLDEKVKQKLDALLSQRQRQPGAAPLAAMAVPCREGLQAAFAGARDHAILRDLLFLDLALEEFLRGTIEKQNLSQFDRDRLAELVDCALRSTSLSADSKELAICAGHWTALMALPRQGTEWALLAKSVADRATRWIMAFTTDVHQCLQPKAEFLGEAFGVDAWTVPLFSEEVIRGGPVFALAIVLRHLDPILRKTAGIGAWQVISPAHAFGQVRVVEALMKVQGERYQEATVLIASAVAGTEEIPEGVTAVLTSDAPDLVSHLAVRARNARVLFATCFDPDMFDRFKALQGKSVSLRVTPGGDVELAEREDKETRRQGDKETEREDKETGRQGDKETESSPPVSLSPCLPVSLSSAVVTQDQFTPAIVGGKANNLNGLRGRLGDWIHLPPGLALPFGAFEGALQDGENRELRKNYEAMIVAAEQDPPGVLARVREMVLTLVAPADLQASLQTAWQRASLPPVPWEQTWVAIRRVWASKWNERAYLSRRARGIPHENLWMAVLIQKVVPADYAFVIHTVNPLTGNRAEIYAEVVLGMGETLVGNYPGRALGFVCRKDDLALHIVSYPSKSLGLYGKGVIFRSDSNGEDLQGFAGAGLYDSFLAEEPEHRLLDYRAEKLVVDQGFRAEQLRSIARIGLEVEKVLGSAQDIEGAVAGGKFYVVQTRPQVGLGEA